MTSAELMRVPLESVFSAEEALLALRDDTRPFALVGSWAGGGAVLGSEPVRFDEGDPLDALGRQPVVDPFPDFAFGGGWVGYLSYGAGRLIENLPPPPPRPVPMPVADLAFYDHVIRLDGAGQWWFEALRTELNEARIEERLAALRFTLAGSPPSAEPFECGDLTPRPGRAGYERAVETCLSYIEAGDLYQANLALRLEGSFGGRGIDLFAKASAELHPVYAAYLGAGSADGDRELVSLSPELFLRRRGQAVVTRPIKGTRPRLPGDKGAAAELAGSSKDRAENVMIVDLMRNDLGRVCDYGSVQARVAEEPEAHPGVWHLVSEVSGRLYDGLGDRELLRATFPPGSVTGAPKIKAQEVIAGLESTGREAYTGAIGFASPVAGLELNVAIRTFEISSGRAWLGVGAGIVADSEPSAEYDEALAKAAPLAAAAGARIAEPNAPSPAAPALPPAIRIPRPDPELGILETMLVADGEPLEADRHLDRLAASAASLYGVQIDRPRLLGELRTAAPPDGDARARITLRPAFDGNPVRIEGKVTSLDPPNGAKPHAPATLEPVTVPGGLGRDKWIDRRLVDSYPAGTEALICDIDGAVLEAGAGNLWIVERGRLVTPPLDGRMLPGVTREALLGFAADEGLVVAEEPIDLDRVRSVAEVFVTSSVRGIGLARLQGGPEPAQDSLSSSLTWRFDAWRRQASSTSSASSVASTASSRTST